MRTRNMLLVAVGIYAVTGGVAVLVVELGKKYGQLRVFLDMVHVTYWLLGCCLASLVGYWATEIIRWWYRRRHPNPPEKPWVAKQQ